MSEKCGEQKYDVVVVGSIFMDLICYADRLPIPGETIGGTDFKTGYGGKGANQVVAAQRLGAKTAFVGKVGRDSMGQQYYDNFKAEGVNVDCVIFEENVPTGVASIMVGSNDGQNLIITVAGATGLMSSAYVQQPASETAISQSRVLICQLEIPTECSHAALKLAKKHGVRTIFNAAPGKTDLPSEMFSLTDILCVNESEAEIITGVSNIENFEQAKLAIDKLVSNFGSKSVIITLGSTGAVVWDTDLQIFELIPAPRVGPVLDTTGAGDCFLGTLAHCIAKGEALIPASRKAVHNASDSVLRKGTQSSFPYTIVKE